MKRYLPIVLLSALFGLMTSCQPGGDDLPSSTPEPEPAISSVADPTPSPTPEPEIQETNADMITGTPNSTPTIDDEDGSMDERTADADVEFVKAVQAADGTWTFQVTVRHPDTGWEDYADGWDVVAPDGTVLKVGESDPFTRLLLHPHENEQPFTRSQSGITVPDGVSQVTVRAHDLVDGFGGLEVIVDLTVLSGPDFEVEKSPEL
jgi:hypothetical protein